MAHSKVLYYFAKEDDEMCFTLEYHLGDAQTENLDQIELFEAIPDKGGDFFWCTAVDAVCEQGICGKGCDDYTPRNGKRGICKFKAHCYEPGEKKTFIVPKKEAVQNCEIPNA